MTFDEAIAPLTRQEFVDRYLSENYLVQKGSAGRFGQLVTWEEINNSLQFTRVESGRVRLARTRSPIAPSEYLTATSGMGMKIDPPRVMKLLAEGATLVVNCVDEVFPGVRDLAGSCEEVFRVPIVANLYAGWCMDEGFALHWDAHDTFIVQIVGRKHWSVYQPTVAHPWKRHLERERPPKPTRPPVWEGVLHDGDLLYMPRGWWHVAKPMGEPTLHVTVDWPHQTGVDMLHWVVNQLQRECEIRSDLPHLRPADAQRAYMNRLRQHVLDALSENILEAFMRVSEGSIPGRMPIRLGSLSKMRSPLQADCRLRLAVGLRIVPEVNGHGNTMAFRVGNGAYSCDIALAPALEMLHRTRPCTLEMLRAAAGPRYATALDAIVLALLETGAVWMEVD